jgi:hypothetical protein
MEGGAVGHNFERAHPGTIPARFGLIWFRSFSACMTGFFMNFELLPILTDYAN